MANNIRKQKAKMGNHPINHLFKKGRNKSKHVALVLALAGCGSSDVYTTANLSEDQRYGYFEAVENYFDVTNLRADIVYVQGETVCEAQACTYNGTVYITEDQDDKRRCRQIMHELGHIASDMKHGDADADHRINQKYFLEYVFDYCDGR